MTTNNYSAFDDEQRLRQFARLKPQLDALTSYLSDNSLGEWGSDTLVVALELIKKARAQEAELYAAQDQITGLQELMKCSDKALANAQRAIPGEGLIPVNAAHLRTVLSALLGMPHQIRELQATASLPGSPITALITEFNSWSGHV